MDKPTVGRIVHYKTLPSEKYPDSILIAAIITQVNEDGSVFLTKFTPRTTATPMHKAVVQGDEPGTWSWPTRV